jgi:sulfatase modifying factor 1
MLIMAVVLDLQVPYKEFFMKNIFWILLFLLYSLHVNAAVSYQLVTVSNAGNASDPTTDFGAVSYDYQIGKYTVTIAQYTEFLNAVAVTDTNGLYNTNMQNVPNVAGIARTGSSGSYVYSVMNSSGNHPITSVSWFSAARFANWMANGQPTGAQTDSTTEDGAYELNGTVQGDTVVKRLINPNTGSAPTFYLPSNDEWYKAAYYNGSGTYYLFATQSNTPPGNAIGGAANQANYISNQTGYCTTQSFTTSTSVNYLTDVGSFTGSPSHYGTFDQTGNVWEWNATNVTAETYATLRGGAYTSTVPPYLLGNYYLSTLPNEVAVNLGFRLAAPI